MANILHKRKQTSLGGSSSIAGLTFQGVKSANFTASANSIYEITQSCIATLPNNPIVNDRVGFIVTSSANLDVLSTERMNGVSLLPDYTKRTTVTFLLSTFTYLGSATGWSFNASNFVDSYVGNAISVPYSNVWPFPRGGSNPDIFYLLGTNAIVPGSSPSAFVNPSTTGKITITASSQSSYSPNITDNASYQSNWGANGSAPHWIKVRFNNGSKVSVTRYAILNIYWANSLSSFILQGSNNDIDWIDLHSGVGLTTIMAQSEFYLSPPIVTEMYQYLRLVCSAGGYPSLIELCLWGLYQA